jgi:hypothetical protein
MDPNEIIKAVPEIVKTVAPIATGAAISFTGVVKKMLGPAADEVAEMLRDRVRMYRYGNQMRCIEKAEKMAKDAGFTPKAVPPKILFPLLEGASFEDDEDLHTMWAALLANAASPENTKKARPGFIAILKQMSPDEAKLMNWVDCHRDPLYVIGHFKLLEAPDDLRWDKETDTTGRPINKRLAMCMEALEATLLIRRHYLSSDRAESPSSSDWEPIPFRFEVTHRGSAFVEACRPPKPKS